MFAYNSARSVRACLAIFILVLSSCSTADRMGPEDQPAGTHRILFDESEAPDSTLGEGFLACEPQSRIKAHETIGPEGGVLEMGPHRLVVPPGALDDTVDITGVVLSDSVISVRLAPRGLRFAIPARLTLSYAHCPPLPSFLARHIVYTSETLDPLQDLPSADDSFDSQVSADLDHFSRYAVAW